MVRRAKAANPLPPGTLAVGTGLMVTGITAYGFLVLTARVLGPAKYAPLSALWALVFLSGPGFFLPLEQEVGRLVASRRAQGFGAGPLVRRAARVGGALVAGLLFLTGVAAPVLRRSLFDGQTLLLLGFGLSLIGYFVSHLTRGTLSGNGRFWSYSMALGGDGALRLVVTLGLAGVGVRTAGPYGLALGITPGLAAAIAMRGQGELLAAGPEAPWGELSAALGWLLAGSVLSQLLANGSVLAVKALATQAEQARAGQFLAGLIVARVPLFLFGAVQAALLPRLASLAGAGSHREFRSGFRRLVIVVAAVGLVGTLGSIAVGPTVVRLLFGANFRLGRSDLGYMALGSAAYMLSLALAQALIALGLHARSVVGWIVGNSVFVVVVMVASNLLLRVELAFLAGSIASVVVMTLLVVTALAGLNGPCPLQAAPCT